MHSEAVEFPFKSVLSFSSLIRYGDRIAAEGGPATYRIWKKIHDELKRIPELLRPIEDLSILEKHRDMIELLMSLVFAPAQKDTEFAAAFVPFQVQSFYATDAFKRLLMSDQGELRFQANINEQDWAWGRLMKAYLHILDTCYHTKLTFDYPLILTTRDPDSGLDRHFHLSMDPGFVEVKRRGKIRPLSEEEHHRLVQNIMEPRIWMELLPPEEFEFHGFGLFRAVEVTDQEVLSSLKRDLIEKESIFSNEGFERLQQKLRAFLRKPDLILGLAAINGEEILVLGPNRKIEKGCIFSDSVHCRKKDYDGSVFARAVENTEPVVIEDLQAHSPNTSIEEEMIREGIRSIFVAPLYYGGRLLGTFDLKSPRAGELNILSTLKLMEILPLFSVALNRGMGELEQRVQAIIKEKCTAIHSCVEWRFRRAALNYIKKEGGSTSGMEHIVFRDVYPLYGVTDVQGSSRHRNSAIQADIADHLKMAVEVLETAHRCRPLPILDALMHRISKNIQEVEKGLTSGDEVARLDFIRQVVEPVFEHVACFGPEITEKINAYRSALDPNMGTLYRKRREFEESITSINEAISSYLEEEEENAQAYFPHYFEKLKTDGVDYTIYIGASLVEDGRFDLLYLRNLRLWQLIVMCGIARRIEQLKPSLKMPLEATHLILVQDSPLSIRFRPDEKRFDVDGAYDIRHEIVKKRIDKAVIKGSSERLTRPGTIAIVYSHGREALEYRDYIDYLQTAGYLSSGVEKLDIEDLEGIYGLKAMRVKVALDPDSLSRPVSPDAVQEAVRATAK